jgi:predicted  nucleic acid-binding Zn-ribbon protein
MCVILFSCSSENGKTLDNAEQKIDTKKIEDSIRKDIEKQTKEKYEKITAMKKELESLEQDYNFMDQNLIEYNARMEVEKTKLEDAKKGVWYESLEEKERKIMKQALALANLKKEIKFYENELSSLLSKINKLRRKLELPRFDTNVYVEAPAQ